MVNKKKNYSRSREILSELQAMFNTKIPRNKVTAVGMYGVIALF